MDDPGIEEQSAEVGLARCIRCGYELRGLDHEGACPECGLGIAVTLAAGTHLQMGRPEWLGRVRSGVWLLVILIPAVIGGMALEGILLDEYRRPDLCWIGPFVLAALHIAAVLLMTSREHRFEKQMKGNSLRVALRASSLGSLVIAGCISMAIYNDGKDPWPWVAGFSFLLWVPTYAMSCLYLRTLARRIGNASLAEHCIIVAVGVSISIVLPMILSLIQPIQAMWPVLVMMVSIILFWLWSSYLFFRFGLVIGRLRRDARRNWRDADAATGER